MNFNCIHFDCKGRVNPNDWELDHSNFISHGEIENVLFPPRDYSFSSTEIKLFDSVVPGVSAIFELGHFTKCMESQFKIINRHGNCSNKKLMSNTNDKGNLFFIRKNICEFILYVRAYMNSINWNYNSLKNVNPRIEQDMESLFNSLKYFLYKLKRIPDATFHYVASNLGNKCMQPEFHMYHLHLELHWFYITLMHLHNTHWVYSIDQQLNVLENSHKLIILNMIYISMKIFERIPFTDLLSKTPYSCTCIRELWLVLQIFIDDLAANDRFKCKSFWDQVNSCIDIVFNQGNCVQNENDVSNGEIHHEQYSLPNCKQPELFSIWMIYHLCLLYGYNANGVYMSYDSARIKPNHEQIHKILKLYVAKKGKDCEREEIDEELKIIISLLKVILNNWWTPNIQTISFLWDCFHRRLDRPFLVQTTGPWTFSIDKKSPMDILNQIKTRINKNIDHTKESSYGMFLHLLGVFLRKNHDDNNKKYWNQLKGRLYSKFSASKVQEFSIIGLYNFFALFLTIAITVDTKNVCTVMFDLLPSFRNMKAENCRKYPFIWKGKLIVLLLYSELQYDYNSIAPSIIEVVNAMSCRKEEASRNMMTTFVDVLSTILAKSNKFGHGEYLFIEGWIDRYFSEYSNNIGVLVEILVQTFEQCVVLKKSGNSDGVKKMLNAFWKHVSWRVRQLAFSTSFPEEQKENLAKLAAGFTLEALEDPVMANQHQHNVSSLFVHFISYTTSRDIKIIRCYITQILENKGIIDKLKEQISSFDLILIQTWIKCSILGGNADRNEIRTLEEYIFQMDEIREIFVKDEDFREFVNDPQPIVCFILASFTKRNTLTDSELSTFDSKFRLYFNNVDKWIIVPLKNENKGRDFLGWIVSCLGTLLLCGAPMLYVKNKPDNMLKTLIHAIIVSTDQSSYMNKMGRNIFKSILHGLENLNVRGDISLQTLTRYVFDQYLPLLITPIGNGLTFEIYPQLLKWFTDAKDEFVILIFEMMTSNFVISTGENTLHKHCHLIMILLKSLIKNNKDNAQQMIKHIVRICLPNVIACYMRVHDHHPHKTQTNEIMEEIFKCLHQKHDQLLRDDLSDVISNSIEKHFSINPKMFEFLKSVARIDINLIKNVLPRIASIVSECERNGRRNVGSLRYSLEQLQNLVQGKL